VRSMIYSSALLAALLLAPFVDGRNPTPASAAENPTPIENAPCGWFTSLYPGAWGTDRKILINPRVAIERTSFGRGTYQLADGTDAYDYLQKKCGQD